MVSSQTVAALYIDSRGPYPDMRDGYTFEPGRVDPTDLDLTIGPDRPIDCWDAARDARKYVGPHPVVAHPPCKHWGRLRHLAKIKCRNCDKWHKTCEWDAANECPNCRSVCRDWRDRDCAPRAVEQVRAYGGVLEHPAGSLLWEACGLPMPRSHELVRTSADADGWEGPLMPPRDAHGGWCVELDQCEWGHVARKRTWLYLVGVPREALEAPPFPGREPTHWISGFRTSTGRSPEHYAKNGSSVPPGIKVCSAQQRRRTPPLFAEYLVRLARAVQK